MDDLETPKSKVDTATAIKMRTIESRFKSGRRLDIHIGNLPLEVESWCVLNSAGADMEGDTLESVLIHYEDFVDRSYGRDPVVAAFVMEKSDSAAIREFNQVIDEMRTNAEAIKQGGKSEAKKYTERLRTIIYGKPPEPSDSRNPPDYLTGKK